MNSSAPSHSTSSASGNAGPSTSTAAPSAAPTTAAGSASGMSNSGPSGSSNVNSRPTVCLRFKLDVNRLANGVDARTDVVSTLSSMTAVDCAGHQSSSQSAAASAMRGSGSTMSYLGKRRRKRSSQPSSRRSSPGPDDAVTGAAAAAAAYQTLQMQSHDQQLKTSPSRYSLLSSSSRTHSPDELQRPAHNASSTAADFAAASSHATVYLPQEPRSPLTPTSSSAVGPARTRTMTASMPSSSLSQAHSADDGGCSSSNVDYNSSLSQASSPGSSRLYDGLEDEPQMSSTAHADAELGHAAISHEALTSRDAKIDGGGGGGRLIRNHILAPAPTRAAAAPTASETNWRVGSTAPCTLNGGGGALSALGGGEGGRQPFMLQPVPPARKRRKVTRAAQVSSGAKGAAVPSSLEREPSQPETVDKDVVMIATPPADPPLREMTLNGAQSQARALAEGNLPMIATDLTLEPSRTLRRRGAVPSFQPHMLPVTQVNAQKQSATQSRPVTQAGARVQHASTHYKAGFAPSFVAPSFAMQADASVPTLRTQNYQRLPAHARFVTASVPLQSNAADIIRAHRLVHRRAISFPNLSAWPTLELASTRRSYVVPSVSTYMANVRGAPVKMAAGVGEGAVVPTQGAHWGAHVHAGVQADMSGTSSPLTSTSSSTSSTERLSAADSGRHQTLQHPQLGSHRSPLLNPGTWGSSAHTSSTIVQPSLYPSITRQTLHELDLSEMSKNPQLRHDVVFDPHVQFRPNFDGERGRKVRESADQYWAAVAREVESGCTCLRFENGEALPCACPPEVLRKTAKDGAAKTRVTTGPYISCPARIPILVHELRAILLSILPPASAFVSQISAPGAQMRNNNASSSSSGNGSGGNNGPPGTLASGTAPASTAMLNSVANSMSHQRMISHHTLVLQMLDPALITQEIKYGVLNLEAMIKFLAKVLKLHCAPMRDELVEKMVRVVCEEGDVVRGLRMCFEILELMKLDIANHQLRSTRPWLVETAVDFEIRWFREQIEQEKFTFKRTSQWFAAARRLTRERLSSRVNVDTAMSRKEFISRAFNDGFLHLLFEAPMMLPVAELMAIGRAGMASGIAPSSSSLNQAYTACYPETFQFDAYRLITFHNDITDLTVVYMFLLLFRQLACSPLDERKDTSSDSQARQASPAAVRAQAALLASNELENMKNRIWCLLNEANAKIGVQSKLGGFSPRASPLPNQEGGSQASGSSSAVSSGGGVGGLVYGNVKFENSIWREGVRDVLLQVAAQATAVQRAAQHAANVMHRVQDKNASTDDMDVDDVPSADHVTAGPNAATLTPPSERVLVMLNSWMDTNLRVNSALHKLCQSRLREVVLAILVDRLAGSPPASTATAVAAAVAAAAEAAGQRSEKDKSRTRARASGLKISTSPSVPAGSASTSPVSLRRTSGEMEREEGGATPTKRIKVGHGTAGAGTVSSSPMPTGVSAFPSSSIVSATSDATSAGLNTASSRGSLAAQQALSLHRLLKGRAGHASTSSPSLTAAGTPSTPSSSSASASALASIPHTPVPRSPLWTTSTPEERDWPSALTRSGLEPFAAEVRLLGDRIATLAAFHLRVFRNLYERLDLADRERERVGGVGGTAGAAQGMVVPSEASTSASTSTAPAPASSAR